MGGAWGGPVNFRYIREATWEGGDFDEWARTVESGRGLCSKKAEPVSHRKVRAGT
jgi:hypothetical protein